ncbi:MAG: circularly permuted type 2 ATP-grasp protein [Bacteroidetes bacterium]|nr:circularly permuted type 2 ATP-grasp protein [Bacteroidota bacterium]
MVPNNNLFESYSVPEGMLDEVYTQFANSFPAYGMIKDLFHSLSQADFQKLNEYAKLSFLNQGITYAVYDEEAGGTEKIFPFDLFPRIIHQEEWAKLEQGLIQRNLALNMFLKDVYGQQRILKDKVVPSFLVETSPHFCDMMKGFTPVGDIYCHICGTDLIRNKDGNFYVLEDNLRCPSGVSYVLSNRETMRRTLSDIFKMMSVEAVSHYPSMLLQMLESVSPQTEGEPVCVLLTPGQYNSAYYEHSFLAQSMGIDLVEGTDLFVENDTVYMRTIRGPQKVDVVYRRVDDDFMDPEVFRKDSILGVKGIMRAYLAGNVTLVNAPGTGVSDDKAICSFVPDMIRYYLDQEPIISNVPTYICERPDDLKYVLEHLPELVVKPVDMSGGYGVTICDRLNQAELEEVKQKIKAKPRNFIAQPKMMLSVHSTYIEDENCFMPRHIDLRTFTLMGKDQTFVLPGGLTRVALKKGSLIVNSSQGGGSKDTWIVAD